MPNSQKSVYRYDISQLFKLMLPILITQVCQAGLALVDTIMAGRVSATDLAGVAVGAGLWMPLFLFSTGILIATTPLLGEAIGENKPEQIPHITQQSLWLALFIGVIGMGLVNVMPLLFSYLGVPTTIVPIAKEYLFGIAFGFPAITLYATLRGYAESLKKPIIVTLISILGVLLVIPANYAFIYGLNWQGQTLIPRFGGAGCGYATALVLWLNLALLASYLIFSKNKTFLAHRFHRHFAKPDINMIKKITQVGLPIGVAVFFEVSLFSLASLVISPLGEIAVASHQVAMSVTSQLFMIPLSVAMALTIMVSNCYGAKDWHGLRRMQWLGLGLSTLIAAVCTGLMALFRDKLPTLFTDNPAVIAQALHLLFFAMVYQLFDAWQVTIAGILRGIQDTTAVMWITLFCYWVVALPLGVYLVRFTDMGNKGFWVALVTGLGIASVLLGLRLWQQQNVLKERWENLG